MLRDLFSLFPAYAGVIPSVKTWSSSNNRTFPRIRGGDPSIMDGLQGRPIDLFPAYAGVIPFTSIIK